VRRLVAGDIGERRPKADLSVFFDLGASREPTDVARDKDEMVGEAISKEHRRKTRSRRVKA
jgi:hypothetical protein